MKSRVQAVFQVSLLGSLAVFIVIILTLTTSSMARKANDLVQPAIAGCPECPPPSVCQNGRCILKKNVVLTDTIELGSDVILDCKGHRITPTAVGKNDDPTTPYSEFEPSQPEVAVFLNRITGAKLQNCIIDGFDSGILLLNNTGLLGNEISHNTINSRIVVIYLSKSDNTLITNNILSFNSERGFGIFGESDNDFNRIIGNKVYSTGSAGTGLVQYPGGVDGPSAWSPLEGNFGEGSLIYLSIPLSGLVNYVINGKLYQITNTHSDLSESNEIINNDVVFLDNRGNSCSQDPETPCMSDADCGNKGVCFIKTSQGIAAKSLTRNTRIIGNTVTGGKRGISRGGHVNDRLRTPGTCQLNSNRLCLNDVHCFIPGIDSTNQGNCINIGTEVEHDALVDGMHIENNRIIGPSSDGMNFPDYNGVAIGNIIDCAGKSSTGMILDFTALETAVIKRNKITGCRTGLEIQWNPSLLSANKFTAQVFQNDIYGNTNNIVASGPSYHLTTELSVGGKGNYWGHSCSEDEGFIEAGKPNADSNDQNVTDSHPYGDLVAGKTDAELVSISTCR